MTDNPFAPPKAEVAAAEAPARPPKRTLWAFAAVMVAFFGYAVVSSIREGTALLPALRPLGHGLVFSCVPFVIAGFVGLAVAVTRPGSGPHAFWATAKALCWVVGGLFALLGVLNIVGEIYNAILLSYD